MTLHDQAKKMACDCARPEHHRTGDATCMIARLLEAVVSPPASAERAGTTDASSAEIMDAFAAFYSARFDPEQQAEAITRVIAAVRADERSKLSAPLVTQGDDPTNTASILGPDALKLPPAVTTAREQVERIRQEFSEILDMELFGKLDALISACLASKDEEIAKQQRDIRILRRESDARHVRIVEERDRAEVAEALLLAKDAEIETLKGTLQAQVDLKAIAEDCAESAEEEISQQAQSLTRLREALAGLVGLTQLLTSRDDLTLGVREALLGNHRIQEAREVLAHFEAQVLDQTAPQESK